MNNRAPHAPKTKKNEAAGIGALQPPAASGNNSHVNANGKASGEQAFSAPFTRTTYDEIIRTARALKADSCLTQVDRILWAIAYSELDLLRAHDVLRVIKRQRHIPMAALRKVLDDSRREA